MHPTLLLLGVFSHNFSFIFSASTIHVAPFLTTIYLFLTVLAESTNYNFLIYCPSTEDYYYILTYPKGQEVLHLLQILLHELTVYRSRTVLAIVFSI